MPDEADLAATFAHMKGVFAAFRDRLVTKSDVPNQLYLETPPSTRYPDGLYFEMVKVGKRYVSFHLMPVYTHPDLLDGMSPELRKRMQGKSCFNFTRVDEPLFAELARLTAAGFARYEAEGTIPSS